MNRSPATFDDSIRRAARWALATHLAGQFLSLATLAVTCRFVAPAQFGVFSTALLVVMLPRTFATVGFGAAIVQHDELRSEQLSTLFWLNLATALLSGVVSGIAGWGLAWWTATPQLTLLAAVLAGTSLLAAASTSHQALLERRLEVPLVQRAKFLAQTAGAVTAVGAAMFDLQAWALVAQQYIEWAVLALLVWRRESWRPAWVWHAGVARELVRFGGYYSLSNLVFFAGQNTDKLLLYLTQGSTAAGQAALGMYSLASNLMMKPVYFVTTPISAVMLPALSRSTGDPTQYAQLVCRFLRMCGLLLVPAGAGLWLVAPEAASVLAGREWPATGALLRTLAPIVLAQGFITLCGTLLGSAGKSGRLLAGAVVTALILAQAAMAGFWLGGQFGDAPLGPTFGVAWGCALATTLVVAVPYLAYCLAQVAIPLRDVLLPLRGAVLATAGMLIVVLVGQRAGLAHESLPALVRLLSQVALGAATYAWLARHDLRWFLNQIRSS